MLSKFITLYLNITIPNNASIDTTIIKVNLASSADTTITEGASSKRLLQTLRSKLYDIIIAIIVAIIFFLIIKFITQLLDILANRTTKYRLTLKKIIPIFRLLMWILATFIVLQLLVPDTRSLFAFFASVGVAIGFASQDILKDIFGGIVIILDRPFQVGDKIQIGNYYGEVIAIGLRSVRIVTPDDSTVAVPNAEVVSQMVSNANSGELNCQVVADLLLPAKIDIEKVKKIAWEAAATSKYVYLKKPIVVLIGDEFKETFLTRIRIKAYVLDTRYEFAFKSEVTESAKMEYVKQNILPTGWKLWFEDEGKEGKEEKEKKNEKQEIETDLL